MRDVTVTFYGKTKSFGRLIAPFFERAFLLESIKCGVDFNAGETLRTEPQPSVLRRLAVEILPPALIIPAAGADVCLAEHRFSLRISNPTFAARLYQKNPVR
jgi:hypothetical protein